MEKGTALLLGLYEHDGDIQHETEQGIRGGGARPAVPGNDLDHHDPHDILYE